MPKFVVEWYSIIQKTFGQRPTTDLKEGDITELQQDWLLGCVSAYTEINPHSLIPVCIDNGLNTSLQLKLLTYGVTLCPTFELPELFIIVQKCMLDANGVVNYTLMICWINRPASPIQHTAKRTAALFDSLEVIAGKMIITSLPRDIQTTSYGGRCLYMCWMMDNQWEKQWTRLWWWFINIAPEVDVPKTYTTSLLNCWVVKGMGSITNAETTMQSEWGTQHDVLVGVSSEKLVTVACFPLDILNDDFSWCETFVMPPLTELWVWPSSQWILSILSTTMSSLRQGETDISMTMQGLNRGEWCGLWCGLWCAMRRARWWRAKSCKCRIDQVKEGVGQHGN